MPLLFLFPPPLPLPVHDAPLSVHFLSRDPRHFVPPYPPSSSHFVTLLGLILFRNAYRRAKQASEIRLDARFIEKSARSIAEKRGMGGKEWFPFVRGMIKFILVEEFWKRVDRRMGINMNVVEKVGLLYEK